MVIMFCPTAAPLAIKEAEPLGVLEAYAQGDNYYDMSRSKKWPRW